MNRKQVILEHREALTAYDVAASKYRSCVNAKKCTEHQECECPALALKLEAQKVVEEKAEALRVINEQTIARNDAQAILNIDKREKRMEERRTMATKLTVDTFKQLANQGLKAAEIAKKTGVSVATVYAKKSEWKKAGLLGDAQPTKKATTVAVASKPIAEQVPVPTQTQTDSVDYKAKYTYQQQTLEALQKSVVEYQESVKIANGAAKEAKERSNRLRDELVNAQNDLRAEINKNIELQEKAQGYEKHAEELEEQLLAERAEIERLRAELKHAKHQAHQNAAPTESVMVARLESELAEMATEVGNAGYEAAHWERKYKQLAKMSGPILKDWVTDLLKEVE